MSDGRSRDVVIHSPTIRLDQFLKWAGVASTGGQAKALVAGRLVRVNGVVEPARSKEISPGDVVLVESGGPEVEILRVTGGKASGVDH